MEPTRHYGDGAGGRIDAHAYADPPDARTRPPRFERKSLGSLIGDFTGQVQTLLRLEVQLAKAELAIELSKAGKGAGLMAGAGAVAYAGFLAVVIAIALLLGSFMPDWLGFLITGALVLGVAMALLSAGRKAMKEADFKLDRTSRTLQEDALWMRQEVAEVKRDPAHLGSSEARR